MTLGRAGAGLAHRGGSGGISTSGLSRGRRNDPRAPWTDPCGIATLKAFGEGVLLGFPIPDQASDDLLEAGAVALGRITPIPLQAGCLTDCGLAGPLIVRRLPGCRYSGRRDQTRRKQPGNMRGRWSVAPDNGTVPICRRPDAASLGACGQRYRQSPSCFGNEGLCQNDERGRMRHITHHAQQGKLRIRSRNITWSNSGKGCEWKVSACGQRPRWTPKGSTLPAPSGKLGRTVARQRPCCACRPIARRDPRPALPQDPPVGHPAKAVFVPRHVEPTDTIGARTISAQRPLQAVPGCQSPHDEIRQPRNAAAIIPGSPQDTKNVLSENLPKRRRP